MMNLKYVESQPHWRVATVALFAQMMGVLIHVEGIPFGSNRSRKKSTTGEMGCQAIGPAGRIGTGGKTGA